MTVLRMQCAIGWPSPRSAAYDRVATSSAIRTLPAVGEPAMGPAYDRTDDGQPAQARPESRLVRAR